MGIIDPNSIKIISFDLDGTLVTDEFTQIVWHKGIPELYAKKHECTLDKAKEVVFHEYSKVGDKAIEWYDINYWLVFFDLDTDWQTLLRKFQHCIKIYPEVIEVLTLLRRSFKLIITSNAAREFLDTEVDTTNISSYFHKIFSATSDFKEVKKTKDFYCTICNLLQVKQEEMIHVGDHFEFDYTIPEQTGITSFYLDRNGKKKGTKVVQNLNEFTKKIQK